MSEASEPAVLDTPIGRAILALELVSRQKGQPCPLEQLAAQAALPVPAMRRVLRSLVELGLLVEETDGASYTLGLRALCLSSLIHRGLPLERIARPIMQELVAQFDETSALNAYLPTEGRSVCIAVEECRKPIQYVLEPGEVKYLHSGAAGKAILAFLPEHAVDRIVARHGLVPLTPNAVTSRTRLSRDLARIRRDGVAVTHGERINGAVGIAAPVHNGIGSVLASLSITIPEIRCSAALIGSATREVKAQARRLSMLLGYEAPDGSTAGPRPQSARRRRA